MALAPQDSIVLTQLLASLKMANVKDEVLKWFVATPADGGLGLASVDDEVANHAVAAKYEERLENLLLKKAVFIGTTSSVRTHSRDQHDIGSSIIIILLVIVISSSLARNVQTRTTPEVLRFRPASHAPAPPPAHVPTTQLMGSHGIYLHQRRIYRVGQDTTLGRTCIDGVTLDARFS